MMILSGGKKLFLSCSKLLPFDVKIIFIFFFWESALVNHPHKTRHVY